MSTTQDIDVQLFWADRNDHPTWKRLWVVTDCHCGEKASGPFHPTNQLLVQCPARDTIKGFHTGWINAWNLSQRFTTAWQDKVNQPDWLEADETPWRDLVVQGPCHGCGLQLERAWGEKALIWRRLNCPRCTTSNNLPNVDKLVVPTPEDTCPFCFFPTKMEGGLKQKSDPWKACRRCKQRLHVPHG